MPLRSISRLMIQSRTQSLRLLSTRSLSEKHRKLQIRKKRKYAAIVRQKKNMKHENRFFQLIFLTIRLFKPCFYMCYRLQSRMRNPFFERAFARFCSVLTLEKSMPSLTTVWAISGRMPEIVVSIPKSLVVSSILNN